MANQRIVVDIIGNDSSFQAALARSQEAAAKFGSGVNRALGSRSGVSVAAQFDPLLERVRKSRAEADELSERLKQLDTGFEGSAQSAGSLGGALLPLIGRASAVGFAVSAAYSASRRLQQALETTGHEATTTSGKLRNFAAALISGDIVGGLEALHRAPQNLDELGISAVEASNRMQALATVAHANAAELSRQSNRSEEGAAAWKRYRQAVDEAGTGNNRLAQQLIDQVAAIQAADNATNALADSNARLGQVFRDVTGQAVLFKGAVDDLGGPRGPGAVDQINAALELERAGRQGAPPQRPLGPAARRANALIVAQGNEDLDEVLRLQTIQRDKLAKAIENSHGNVKQRQELARNYALAVAAVTATQRQIAAQNQAEAQAAAQAAQQARDNRWAKIIGALDIGVTRSQLTARLNDDLAALEALKDGLERQIKAGVDVASAQSRLAQTDISIAAKQEEIRQAAQAAIQARQFRAIGLSVTGDEIVPGIENLQKRIAAALRKFDSGDLNIGSKLVKQLKLAKALIAKEGDEVTRTTRDKINQILKAAEGGDTGTGEPKFRVPNFSDKFRNLGLTQQQLIAVRSAAASIGGPLIPQQLAAQLGGGTNVSVPTTVININGPVNPANGEQFIRDMERRAQRTSVARTGPMSGRQVS